MRSSPSRLRAVLVLPALAGGTVAAAGAHAQALGIEEGRALYGQHCASCHGAELEG